MIDVRVDEAAHAGVEAGNVGAAAGAYFAEAEAKEAGMRATIQTI